MGPSAVVALLCSGTELPKFDRIARIIEPFRAGHGTFFDRLADNEVQLNATIPPPSQASDWALSSAALDTSRPR